MDTTKILTKMILSLALGGGFGYINYYILNNLRITNIGENDKDEKIFSLILFSILNIVLFNLANSLIHNIYLNILATLIVTVILSFTVFKWIMKFLYFIINKSRKKSNLGESNNRSVRSLIFDSNKVLFVYLYGLENDKLLSYGCMGWQNESKNKDYDFEIVPTDLIKPETFDEAVLRAQKHVDASIYINIDKKIKMVVIPESE